MEEESIFDVLSPELVLRCVSAEIKAAKMAQKIGKPLPKLKYLALVLMEGEFNKIPNDLWTELGFLLVGANRSKRGRPTTKMVDYALAKEYIQHMARGKKDKETIKFLQKSRNHSDERSTRRALARGRKIYNELRRESEKMLCKSVIDGSGNAFTGSIVLKETTDKKD